MTLTELCKSYIDMEKSINVKFETMKGPASLARACLMMKGALGLADSYFSLLYHRYRRPLPTDLDIEVGQALGKIRTTLAEVEKIVEKG